MPGTPRRGAPSAATGGVPDPPSCGGIIPIGRDRVRRSPWRPRARRAPVPQLLVGGGRGRARRLVCAWVLDPRDPRHSSCEHRGWRPPVTRVGPPLPYTWPVSEAAAERGAAADTRTDRRRDHAARRRPVRGSPRGRLACACTPNCPLATRPCRHRTPSSGGARSSGPRRASRRRPRLHRTGVAPRTGPQAPGARAAPTACRILVNTLADADHGQAARAPARATRRLPWTSAVACRSARWCGGRSEGARTASQRRTSSTSPSRGDVSRGTRPSGAGPLQCPEANRCVGRRAGPGREGRQRCEHPRHSCPQPSVATSRARRSARLATAPRRHDSSATEPRVARHGGVSRETRGSSRDHRRRRRGTLSGTPPFAVPRLVRPGG